MPPLHTARTAQLPVPQLHPDALQHMPSAVPHAEERHIGHWGQEREYDTARPPPPHSGRRRHRIQHCVRCGIREDTGSTGHAGHAGQQASRSPIQTRVHAASWHHIPFCDFYACSHAIPPAQATTAVPPSLPLSAQGEDLLPRPKTLNVSPSLPNSSPNYTLTPTHIAGRCRTTWRSRTYPVAPQLFSMP